VGVEVVEDAVGHPARRLGEHAQCVLPGAPDYLDDFALLRLYAAEVDKDMIEANRAHTALVISVDEDAGLVRHLSGDAVVESDVDGADRHALGGDELTPVGDGVAPVEGLRVLYPRLPAERLPELRARGNILGLGVDAVEAHPRPDEVEVGCRVVEGRVGAGEAQGTWVDAGGS
jgi:hypothetical protein